MFEELGQPRNCALKTDTSAVKATVSKSSRGRHKHLDTNLLWVQEQGSKGAITYLKVPRHTNGDDWLTHHDRRDDESQHSAGHGMAVIC